MVSCLAGGCGLDDDVLPPLWDLLDDLVGGGGGSPLSLRPLRLKPLRLLGNGGNPCKEDIAILSCMLKNKCEVLIKASSYINLYFAGMGYSARFNKQDNAKRFQ